MTPNCTSPPALVRPVPGIAHEQPPDELGLLVVPCEEEPLVPPATTVAPPVPLALVVVPTVPPETTTPPAFAVARPPAQKGVDL